MNDFNLPTRRIRGYKLSELKSKERAIRLHYNTGTEENPIYKAYDLARVLWEAAPAYQFLKLK